MIKHIVFFRLKNREDPKSREDEARAIKQKVEGLRGKIPGLLHIELGIDFGRSDFATDVVLYSELESREALDVYQKHPAHQEVVSFISERRTERQVGDYEV